MAKDGSTSDGGSISDEEWARFLKDAEAGSQDAPKEPSARARMVARRLREEPAPPPGWRTHQPVKERRGQHWYALGLVLAVVVLLLLVMDPGRMTGLFDGDGDTSHSASRTLTREDPFKGSPAAQWADGPAGIQLPAARAVGWMSRAEVAVALERTRDFLVASSLDPGVLRGERPTRAIALINPHQKGVQGFLRTAFDAPSRENDPLMMFSRFDRSKAVPVGDVVKTRGQITFQEGERGALRVTADVTYVYPVAPASGGDAVTRTIARRETVLSWDDPAKVRTEPGTFSLVSYKVDSTNGGCATPTGYFEPDFGRGSRDADGTEQVDPFDRDNPIREGSGTDCGTATRS